MALPSKQKAARFHPKDQSVHIDEISVPSIKPDELLVKVRAATLCHSDLMLFETSKGGPVVGKDPITMGHEASGTIVEVGSEAEGFKKDDRIGWLLYTGSCWKCEACQIHPLYCEGGKAKMQGFGGDGYFQEYVAIKWQNAAHLPKGMDLTNSAPLFCAGTTSFNAVTETVQELGGDLSDKYVAVVGAGGLGHLAIQYLKAYGCKVIAIDLADGALEEAKSHGADHVFNPKTNKDYHKEIRRQVTKNGVHAAIIFTDAVQAYTDATKIIRFNGVLMAVGLPAKPVPIYMMDISMWRLRLRGANNGRTDQLKKCVEFSHKHGIKPSVKLYKLDQFHEMLDIMRAGKQKGRMGVLFDEEAEKARL